MIRFASVCLAIMVALPSFGAESSTRPGTSERLNLTLAELGCLDVTADPYNADPTGQTDSTKALQKAIEDAYAKQMVCFFPVGNYLISDTLLASQDPNTHEQTNYLVGSTAGPQRPKLILAPSTPGFDDPENPKSMVRIWTRPNEKANERTGHPVDSWDPDHENAAQGFLQTFRGIDFEISEGNPGAVGLRMTGAQHSEICDTKVVMKSGFAGIYNMPGVNGVVANIEVVGGRYGIYAPKAQYATLTGIRLIDQEEYAMADNSPNPMMVGFYIKKKQAPAIRVEKNQWKLGYGSGEAGFLDGVIDIEEPSDKPVIDAVDGVGLAMRNVFIKNAKTIIKSGDQAPVLGKGEWTRVDEYVTIRRDQTPSSRPVGLNVIDGEIKYEDIVKVEESSAPKKDYVAHHLYDPESFPSADVILKRFNAGDPDVAIITGFRDMPVTSVGDAKTADKPDDPDSADFIQKMIDSAKIVFVPKGKFLIGKTLRLNADTQLTGLAHYSAIIRTHSNWKPVSETNVIETVDDAKAKTVMGNLRLEFRTTPPENNWFCAVNWKAGRDSVVRQMFLRPQHFDYKAAKGQPKPAWKISGNGGGRWYGCGLGPLWTSNHPDARNLLVDGTHEPLIFYNLNMERGLGDYQAEFRNAKNVAILESKHEFTNAFLFKNCSNIVLFVDAGSAENTVVDCKDVWFGIISNKKFTYQANDGVLENDPLKNVALHEIVDGKTAVKIPTEQIIGVYKRGSADFSFISE